MKKIVSVFVLAFIMSCKPCDCIKESPIIPPPTINVRDSIVIHERDSIIYIPRETSNNTTEEQTSHVDNAKRNLLSGILNNGITYTNPEQRVSVIVIGNADNPEQFWNTLDHEKGHVVEHIADAVGIDNNSEEYQYLRGYIAQKMYPAAVNYICPCHL